MPDRATRAPEPMIVTAPATNEIPASILKLTEEECLDRLLPCKIDGHHVGMSRYVLCMTMPDQTRLQWTALGDSKTMVDELRRAVFILERNSLTYNYLLREAAAKLNTIQVWNDLCYLVGWMQEPQREVQAVRMNDTITRLRSQRLLIALGLLQGDEDIPTPAAVSIQTFVKTLDAAILGPSESLASILFTLAIIGEIEAEFTNLSLDVSIAPTWKQTQLPPSPDQEVDTLTIQVGYPCDNLRATVSGQAMVSLTDLITALCERWSLIRPAFSFFAEAAVTSKPSRSMLTTNPTVQPAGIEQVGLQAIFQFWPLQPVAYDSGVRLQAKVDG